MPYAQRDMRGLGSHNFSGQALPSQQHVTAAPSQIQHYGNYTSSFQPNSTSTLADHLPDICAGLATTGHAEASQHHNHPGAWPQSAPAGMGGAATGNHWQPMPSASQQLQTSAVDIDPLEALLPGPERPSSAPFQPFDWNGLQQAVGTATQHAPMHSQASGTGPLQQRQPQPAAQSCSGLMGSQLAPLLQQAPQPHSTRQGGGLGANGPRHAGQTGTRQAPASHPAPAGFPGRPSGDAGLPGPMGPLTRTLSAPAGEALLSRTIDATPQLPEKLDIICGTARGTLLLQRARILHEGAPPPATLCSHRHTSMNSTG